MYSTQPDSFNNKSILTGTDEEGEGEWGKKYVGKIIDRKALYRVISVKRKVDQFFQRDEQGRFSPKDGAEMVSFELGFDLPASSSPATGDFSRIREFVRILKNMPQPKRDGSIEE